MSSIPADLRSSAAPGDAVQPLDETGEGFRIALQHQASVPIACIVFEGAVEWHHPDRPQPLRIPLPDILDVLFVPTLVRHSEYEATGAFRVVTLDGDARTLGNFHYVDSPPRERRNTRLYDWVADAIVARAQAARGEPITAGTSSHAMRVTRELGDGRVEFVEERIDGLKVSMRAWQGPRALAFGALFGLAPVTALAAVVSLAVFPLLMWLVVPAALLLAAWLLSIVVLHPSRVALDFRPTGLVVEGRQASEIRWSDVVDADIVEPGTEHVLGVKKGEVVVRLADGGRTWVQVGLSNRPGYATALHVAWIAEMIRDMAAQACQGTADGIPEELRRIRGQSARVPDVRVRPLDRRARGRPDRGDHD